nr:hypothetical protein [Paenibacillus sabuli]
MEGYLELELLLREGSAHGGCMHTVDLGLLHDCSRFEFAERRPDRFPARLERFPADRVCKGGVELIVHLVEMTCNKGLNHIFGPLLHLLGTDGCRGEEGDERSSEIVSAMKNGYN